MLGEIIGSVLGFWGNERTNDANQEMSRETRDWQERMSNTSYQRAVGDLKAAGLNPMLAYGQGGASSPSASSPVMTNSVSAGLASAGAVAGVAVAREQAEQVKETTEQLKAQTDKIRAETLEKNTYSAIAQAQLRKLQLEGDTESGKSEVADVAGKSAHRTYEAEVKHHIPEQRALSERADSEVKQLNALRDKTTFSADVARRRYETELTRLGIPPASVEADFAEDSKGMSPWLRNLVMLLRGVHSAGAVINRR